MLQKEKKFVRFHQPSCEAPTGDLPPFSVVAPWYSFMLRAVLPVAYQCVESTDVTARESIWSPVGHQWSNVNAKQQ